MEKGDCNLLSLELFVFVWGERGSKCGVDWKDAQSELKIAC
jgi:hypothetical protein